MNRERAAIVVSATVGEYGLFLMPFIVTAMNQVYGLDQVEAGYAVSAQLFAMGAAGWIVSHLVTRVPPRSIIVAGALSVMLANAICALGAGDPSLWVGRLITGIGEGSLMAAAGAIAARVENPHQLFSRLGLVIAAVAAVALFATPVLIESTGPRAVFWLLTVVPIFALIGAIFLPAGTGGSADAPRFGAIAVRGALPLLLSFALMWAGLGALYVFAEGIGTTNGLTLAQIGYALAIAQLIGVAGPVLAARVAPSNLRTAVLVCSIAAALAGLLFVYAPSASLYGIGAAVLSVAAMLLAPCFRSLMAQLDDSGGVVAMSVPFYTLGFALAPLLAGALLTLGNRYAGIAWFGASALAASGLIVRMSGRVRVASPLADTV